MYVYVIAIILLHGFIATYYFFFVEMLLAHTQCHALPLIISLEIDLACGQLKCVCIINDPLPCGDVASKIEMYCFKVVLVSAKK